jgi:hypothetical protein
MPSRITRTIGPGDPYAVAAQAAEDKDFDAPFGASMGEEDEQTPVQSDCADLVKQNEQLKSTVMLMNNQKKALRARMSKSQSSGGRFRSSKRRSFKRKSSKRKHAKKSRSSRRRR